MPQLVVKTPSLRCADSLLKTKLVESPKKKRETTRGALLETAESKDRFIRAKIPFYITNQPYPSSSKCPRSDRRTPGPVSGYSKVCVRVCGEVHPSLSLDAGTALHGDVHRVCRFLTSPKRCNVLRARGITSREHYFARLHHYGYRRLVDRRFLPRVLRIQDRG